MKISFLITHYNRIHALKECIQSIKKINVFNYEIVVSDDFSNENILKQLRDLEIDKLVLDTKNRGLGRNINKGIDKCTGNYIFYIQEDFIINDNVSEYILEAIKLLENEKFDIVRFYVPYKFSKKTTIKTTFNFYEIPIWDLRNYIVNQFRYSDWPHLKKKTFHNKFGYYLENVKVIYTENEFMVRMMRLQPKIAASYLNFCEPIQNIKSVREDSPKVKRKFILRKFLRALRFNIEMILYSKVSRKLKTFKYQSK